MTQKEVESFLRQYTKPQIKLPEEKECLSPVENCLKFLSKDQTKGLCENCRFNKYLALVKEMNP